MKLTLKYEKDKWGHHMFRLYYPNDCNRLQFLSCKVNGNFETIYMIENSRKPTLIKRGKYENH